MVTRTRSPLRRVIALTMVAALAAACGGNDPSASPTATQPPSASGSDQPSDSVLPAATDALPVLTNAPTTTDPAVVPVSGGKIVVSIDGESSGYNPTVDAWANGGHNVAKAIFDTLATFDASGKVVPYLAEAIAANADATVWTITLRPGIKFHDDSPLNADAVRINFEAVQASASYKDQLKLLASMKVVDDLTIELTMSAPWGTFPNSLTGTIGSQIGYIAAPAMLANADGGRTPIGTGPFKFVEWIPDDHLTVARNDNYWQHTAYLDQVTFKPIPDSTSRKAAFDAGDIDVYYSGSSSEIQGYLAQQQAGKLNVTIGAPAEPDMLMLNTLKAPLDDVRVRRALAMSVDMTRIFDYLDATGVKQTMTGPYASSSFWFVKSNYPEYDLAAAKTLIDAYTAEKGPVQFDFVGNQDPFIVSLQELYQSMWSEIGVTTSIVSRSQGENIDAVVAGDYQVIMWGGVGGGDPDNDYSDFHSGTGLNFSGFNSPTMDAALDAGRALSDPEARKTQYAIVQKELGDAVPYIWTGTNQFAVMTKVNLLGIGGFLLPDGSPGQPITGGQFFLKDVWLAA